jgi:hypothetical protein
VQTETFAIYLERPTGNEWYVGIRSGCTYSNSSSGSEKNDRTCGRKPDVLYEPVRPKGVAVPSKTVSGGRLAEARAKLFVHRRRDLHGSAVLPAKSCASSCGSTPHVKRPDAARQLPGQHVSDARCSHRHHLTSADRPRELATFPGPASIRQTSSTLVQRLSPARGSTSPP